MEHRQEHSSWETTSIPKNVSNIFTQTWFINKCQLLISYIAALNIIISELKSNLIPIDKEIDFIPRKFWPAYYIFQFINDPSSRNHTSQISTLGLPVTKPVWLLLLLSQSFQFLEVQKPNMELVLMSQQQCSSQPVPVLCCFEAFHQKI